MQMGVTMNEFLHISSESKLIDENLKEQLKTVLDKLTKEIYLVSIVDEKNIKCIEMVSFLKSFSSINSKIHLEMYEKGENTYVEDTLKCEGMLPVVGLYNSEKEYTGISFFGIPGGKELNSFVLAIYNVASIGQAIDKKLTKRILRLKQKFNIGVCVSLACHYCADTVSAYQRIASLNPNIEAAMIDATLYPGLIEKYKLERVPVAIINEKECIVGGKSIEEIIDILEKF